MKRKTLLAITTLFVLGFLVYSFNLKNVLFWDDEDWIINNPAVHQLTWPNIQFIFSHDVLAGIGLHSNYYRPILLLTFMANYIVAGVEPLLYHLVNNLVHILNGVLIFVLLDRYIKRRLVAFLAAAFFIIHPLQTEAIAYISGRGDPLSVLCILASILLFLVGRELWYQPGSYSRVLRTIALAGSYLLFVTALFVRETAVLMPLYLGLFLVSLVYPGESIWRSMKKNLVWLAPYALTSVGYFIARITVLNFQNSLNFYTQPTPYSEHLSYRIFTFFHVITEYLRLAFIPVGLHMERNVAVSTSVFRSEVLGGVAIVGLIVLILGILYYWAYIKHQAVRNTVPNTFQIWLLAWGLFFINLIPTSGIIPINSVIYEHWLYFSLAGLGLLIAWYSVKLLDYAKERSRYLYRAIWIVLAGYAGFLSYQSIQRNIIWGRPIDLYENILRYEPDSMRVLTNLGNLYGIQGKVEKSEELYRKAIAVDNTHPQQYYNLANLLVQKGSYPEAINLYKQAITIDSQFYYAYQNLAVIYARIGQIENARDALQQLAKFRPLSSEVWFNMALVENALGHKDKAKEYLLKAAKLPKDDPTTNDRISEFAKQLRISIPQ